MYPILKTDIHTLDDAKRINNETIKNGNEFIIINRKTLNPIIQN